MQYGVFGGLTTKYSPGEAETYLDFAEIERGSGYLVVCPPNTHLHTIGSRIKGVLDARMAVTHNQLLGCLRPGARICFEGRVYVVRRGSSSFTLTLVDTGIVAGRVTQTSKRMVDTAVTVTITTADGAATVIIGTTNHPCYVPAVHDFVAMGELNVRTVLQTATGATAVVQSKAVRYGCFYVYNFKVAGEHNYYVADAGVLVHNGGLICDPEPNLKALKGAVKMTTPQCTKAAEALGFVKTKFISNGEAVYYNRKMKRYITQDIGDGTASHKGGVWKMAKTLEELGSDTTRMGTYDAALNRIGD